ncbi:MAG: hypothetical protein HQK51_00410 [Oligoflexia bacterium]|nr:hypothetical protein [Oligoflexia bacterium]
MKINFICSNFIYPLFISILLFFVCATRPVFAACTETIFINDIKGDANLLLKNLIGEKILDENGKFISPSTKCVVLRGELFDTKMPVTEDQVTKNQQLNSLLKKLLIENSPISVVLGTEDISFFNRTSTDADVRITKIRKLINNDKFKAAHVVVTTDIATPGITKKYIVTPGGLSQERIRLLGLGDNLNAINPEQIEAVMKKNVLDPNKMGLFTPINLRDASSSIQQVFWPSDGVASSSATVFIPANSIKQILKLSNSSSPTFSPITEAAIDPTLLEKILSSTTASAPVFFYSAKTPPTLADDSSVSPLPPLPLPPQSTDLPVTGFSRSPSMPLEDGRSTTGKDPLKKGDPTTTTSASTLGSTEPHTESHADSPDLTEHAILKEGSILNKIINNVFPNLNMGSEGFSCMTGHCLSESIGASKVNELYNDWLEILGEVAQDETGKDKDELLCKTQLLTQQCARPDKKEEILEKLAKLKEKNQSEFRCSFIDNNIAKKMLNAEKKQQVDNNSKNTVEGLIEAFDEEKQLLKDQRGRHCFEIYAILINFKDFNEANTDSPNCNPNDSKFAEYVFMQNKWMEKLKNGPALKKFVQKNQENSRERQKIRNARYGKLREQILQVSALKTKQTLNKNLPLLEQIDTNSGTDLDEEISELIKQIQSKGLNDLKAVENSNPNPIIKLLLRDKIFHLSRGADRARTEEAVKNKEEVTLSTRIDHEAIGNRGGDFFTPEGQIIGFRPWAAAAVTSTTSSHPSLHSPPPSTRSEGVDKLERDKTPSDQSDQSDQ